MKSIPVIFSHNSLRHYWLLRKSTETTGQQCGYVGNQAVIFGDPYGLGEAIETGAPEPDSGGDSNGSTAAGNPTTAVKPPKNPGLQNIMASSKDDANQKAIDKCVALCKSKGFAWAYIDEELFSPSQVVISQTFKRRYVKTKYQDLFINTTGSGRQYISTGIKRKVAVWKQYEEYYDTHVKRFQDYECECYSCKPFLIYWASMQFTIRTSWTAREKWHKDLDWDYIGTKYISASSMNYLWGGENTDIVPPWLEVPILEAFDDDASYHGFIVLDSPWW